MFLKNLIKRIVPVLIYIGYCCCFSQDGEKLKWWNPINDTGQNYLEGQVWPKEVEGPYFRLPERVADKLSHGVYNLGKQAAGLMIRFQTNGSSIHVRYQIGGKGNYGFEHMPATGVSGVDLYTFDSNGKEIWCAASRKFSDTISYVYKKLGVSNTMREYRLYLPLYNQVTKLEIGVDSNSKFSPLPTREEKPIVVYGTSIAQGACASRPGMAWTAQLSRALELPLVNLGFSGSGRLEIPMIDLMTEIDARVYILDCMPNLTPVTWKNLGIKNDATFKERIHKAVAHLRSKRINTPILLVEHAGYSDEYVSPESKKRFQKVNKLQYEVYLQLLDAEIKNLYYMTKEEIGLQIDDTVDAVHPTDLGMKHYAQAYINKLVTILD
ncbi:SGNH/GDSL hydrolase family protein [Flagellimonas sp. S3867]|uniref:SGNH/GDSL hydrolase family protein n=1 Tax=Flagellimonas sp. S3867 TaxID=2768063 RepID=UPI00168759DA|nr:SGNH/GDSL hydrolase family protein [Flagellimonas sp. S3867]